MLGLLCTDPKPRGSKKFAHSLYYFFFKYKHGTPSSRKLGIDHGDVPSGGMYSSHFLVIVPIIFLFPIRKKTKHHR